jgi:hypothetical protein
MSRKTIWSILLSSITALACYIFRSIAREIWLYVKVPFEMIHSFHQILTAWWQFQEQIQALQYALNIFNSLTTQPLLQGISHSISPFANLIWLLCGSYILFKIILPVIYDAL